MERVSLLAAFQAAPRRVLALAGGGGKTSLMWALCHAAVGAGWRALSTTTTRIWPPTPAESPACVLLEEERDALGALRRRLARAAHVTLAGRRVADGKLAGVAPAVVDACAADHLADLIVVEADGSAGRPLKAARDGEPVFPASTTHTVLLMGIEALGAPLGEAAVFRSALAAEITGLDPGAPVTAEAATALLLGPRGLARTAPATSRLIVFLNKVEDPGAEARAYTLARALGERREPRLDRVVVGSLRRAEAGFTLLGSR